MDMFSTVNKVTHWVPLQSGIVSMPCPVNSTFHIESEKSPVSVRFSDLLIQYDVKSN